MGDKPHILIVEDDLDLSDMLYAYFDTQGYEVSRAAWGEDALRMSMDRIPDLVVLDVRLPDIDGYEVCRRMRGNRRTQDVPIIFLTEKRDRVDKLTGLELGVVDYITKPFDIQELRLRVRNSLRRAEQQPLMNPVTNLPEGQLTEEKMRDLLKSGNVWAMLYVNILGLDQFRDLYGFVAADDVLRGVALMMNNALREQGSTSDTIGHLSAYTFLIITVPEHVNAIRERVEGRIRRSMALFQPAREEDGDGKVTLRLSLSVLTHTDGGFDDENAVKNALIARASAQD
jgi:PleD family two-component response regulator